MEIYQTLSSLKTGIASARKAGKTIGLVPTMGNLHDGHLALVEEAHQLCDFVIATIFVNPLQFGPNEDYQRYPRSYKQDVQVLTDNQCDALFVPDVAEVYPDGMKNLTSITVPEISTLYCGASRPGHFDGVCTVVCKLFSMVQPDIAFFGLKDFQQFHIIQKMTQDLSLPVRLEGIATIREESGLALSSRNSFLSAKQKVSAASLQATLLEMHDKIIAGNSNFSSLEQDGKTSLSSTEIRLDFLHICNKQTLLPAKPEDKEIVILAAIYIGDTRLIDNITVLQEEFAH